MGSVLLTDTHIEQTLVPALNHLCMKIIYLMCELSPKFSTNFVVAFELKRLTHLSSAQLECEGLVAVKAAREREREANREVECELMQSRRQIVRRLLAAKFQVQLVCVFYFLLPVVKVLRQGSTHTHTHTQHIYHTHTHTATVNWLHFAHNQEACHIKKNNNNKSKKHILKQYIIFYVRLVFVKRVLEYCGAGGVCKKRQTYGKLFV